MPAKTFVSNILENTKVDENIYRMVVENGGIKPQPGQFYMVRSHGPFPCLGRPISVNDANDSTVTFLFEVRGEGTKILSQLRPQDQVELIGPLGNGFDTQNIHGKVAIVCGGIGVAPMIYTAKCLKGCTVDFFAGFRDHSYQMDAVADCTNIIKVSTDNGNEGHKGFVTELLNVADYDVVLACGPEIMMKKLAAVCQQKKVKCYVSLERHMACGIGACLGCTCHTVKGAKCVCKDGPVFCAEEVMCDAEN